MLKYSVFSDEISQDLSKAIALAKEFDIPALELRSVWDKGVFQLETEDVKRLKKELTRAGMKVSAIASPFYKCDAFDADAIRQHNDGLRRMTELASELGTNIIRGFTFFYHEEMTPVRIAERLLEQEALLTEMGCILALESDPSVNACNGTELGEIIRSADSPVIRATWDPGNDLFAPRTEQPFPQGYEAIKDYIAHVHLKDSVVEEGTPRAVCLFTGQAHLKEFLDTLDQRGYDGYLSVETHYRKRTLSEDELRLPGGAAFTDGGYEATRECLESLKAYRK